MLDFLLLLLGDNFGLGLRDTLRDTEGVRLKQFMGFNFDKGDWERDVGLDSAARTLVVSLGLGCFSCFVVDVRRTVQRPGRSRWTWHRR